MLGLNSAIASVVGVFLLVLTPVVFSLWSEELTVGGTVETGEFPTDGRWFGYSCNTFPEKDESVGWSLRPDEDDPLKLEVNLTNGYAGWALYCEIHLANTDARPLQIVDVLVDETPSSAVKVEWRQDPGDPRKKMKPCSDEPSWPTKPNNVSPANCRQEVQILIIFQHAASHATVSFTALLDDPGGYVETGGLPSLDGLLAAEAAASDDTMDAVAPVTDDTTGSPETEQEPAPADEEPVTEPAPETPDGEGEGTEGESSEGETTPDESSDSGESEGDGSDDGGASEESSDSSGESSADPEG